MKKFTQLLLIAGLVFLSQIYALGQTSKITVVHTGVSTFYNNMTPALAAAVAGDTIYLPGGGIPASSYLIINKSLTIIGAGHYPDSTTATYQTLLPDIFICTGADNGSISGIFSNSIQFGIFLDGTTQNVNNYRIERCYIGNLQPSYSTSCTSQNILISENIICGITGGSFSTVLFEKTVFSNCSYNYPSYFNNCIFIFNHYINFNNSSLTNNIFYNVDIDYSENIELIGTQNILTNNLFCAYSYPYNVLVCGSNICNNGITEQLIENTFKNALGSSFLYTNSYHLKETSPGKNAGTDGTDVGIYGTIYPAKDGAVPFNPHISYKNIGTVLTPTGVLSVDVKVSAQDR